MFCLCLMRDDEPENIPPSTTPASSTVPSKAEACAFLMTLWGCTSLLLTALVFCIVFAASYASNETSAPDAAFTSMTACGMVVLFGAAPAGLLGGVVIYARFYARPSTPPPEQQLAEVL